MLLAFPEETGIPFETGVYNWFLFDVDEVESYKVIREIYNHDYESNDKMLFISTDYDPSIIEKLSLIYVYIT